MDVQDKHIYNHVCNVSEGFVTRSPVDHPTRGTRSRVEEMQGP